MYEAKTKVTGDDVLQVIKAANNPKKEADALQLLQIFERATGCQPKVWGNKMIGYGLYRYKYASGHQGEAFTTGFAIAKAHITLYMIMEEDVKDAYIKRLGKARASKGCVYINKLADVDTAVLQEMIHEARAFAQKHFEVKE